jgi:hippurate hydrolase
VHFIFQPAEEGQGGGRVMVEEGLFDRFPVDAVYGLHNHPGLEVGKFQTRSGAFMAASDSWTVTFHGTGGHGGAGPHLATDATVAQAQFVLALQAIIGRNVPATTPAVLSVGHIAAGSWGSPNVMPSEVVVRGTARSYEPAVRDLLERRIAEVASAMAAGQGCTVSVLYERRYPPLVTHEEQTRICAAAAAAVVGEAAVSDTAPLRTGAEDFSFMLQKRPGSFMFIGNGAAEDGTFHNVHTPLYDFNDKILTLGAAYWVSLVEHELNV